MVISVKVTVMVMVMVMVMACRQQQLTPLDFAGTRWSHLHTSAVGDRTLRVRASQEPMKRSLLL